MVDTSYWQEFRELFDANFGRVEARLGAMDARIAGLEAAMDARMAGLEANLIARMDLKIESLKAELLKWMFLFWVGTMGTVLAIVKL